MARSKRNRLALAAAALILFSAPGAAELPPYVYEKMQREAPERLVVLVTSVSIGADIAAQATVQKVHRTQSALKAGEKIRIRYARPRENDRRPGPGQLPVLGKGLYEAYLAKEGPIYAPAAGARSFVSSSAAPASR